MADVHKRTTGLCLMGGVCHVSHDVFSSAAGGAYWPIAIRCPSLGPFPSIGGGAHRPLTSLCPSSSFFQNCVNQKWPNKIFPIVNFVFSHNGQFGL